MAPPKAGGAGLRLRGSVFAATGRLGGRRRSLGGGLAAGPGAVFHEGVELRIVAGVAQALQEGLEGLQLVIQTAQRPRLFSISRRGTRPRPRISAPRMAAEAAGFAEHAFSPDHVGQKGQAQGPEDDEAQDHGGDPRGPSLGVEPRFPAAKPAEGPGGRMDGGGAHGWELPVDGCE